MAELPEISLTICITKATGMPSLLSLSSMGKESIFKYSSAKKYIHLYLMDIDSVGINGPKP